MVGSEADRAALLRDSGGPAKLDGQSVFNGEPLHCLFRDEHQPQQIGDQVVSVRVITAMLLAPIARTARRGVSSLEYGGKLYTVQDVEDHGVGFAHLILTEAN